jgi:hypothetical protein
MNHSTHSGSPKRLVMALTVARWAVVTAAYAYIYVTSRVGLPGAVGYETDWSWQLFFFSLVRLPLLILVLGALLYVEHLFWSRGTPSHRAA